MSPGASRDPPEIVIRYAPTGVCMLKSHMDAVEQHLLAISKVPANSGHSLHKEILRGRKF